MKLGILSHLHFPIAEPYAGGLEAHTGSTALALAARGHAVVLAAKAGSRLPHPGIEIAEAMPESFTWRHVDGAEADAQERTVAEATRHGIRLLREAGCDAILNNSLSPVPYLELDDLPTLTLLHTPATLDRVNAALEDPGWRPSPRHAWASVSASNAIGWRTRLPEVRVIRNGIDLGRWPARLGPRADDAEPFAVWTGRITPEKGTRLAIDAARLAGWRLAIAGAIYDREYFENEVAPALGPSTRYLGHLDHAALHALVRNADVQLVTPRWPEPFGLVAVEAMASGTPVAALAMGALPEIVGPTGGALADAATPASLAAALTTAAGMPRELVRRRAERFDEASAIDAYLEVIEELLGVPSTSPAAA